MSEDEQLRRILEAIKRIEKKLDMLPCVRNKGRCPYER